MNIVEPRIFNVSLDNRFERISTSKGNQLKWIKDGCYLKADTMGYESIAEVVASELALHIDNFDFINYFLCEITEGNKTYQGCYSENFLSDGEVSFSCYRLLGLHLGSDRKVDDFLRQTSGKELVDFILDMVKSSIDLDIVSELGRMLYFDAIILNEDRHLNNIIFANKDDTWRLVPTFDNGLSCLSDLNDYPFGTQVSRYINKVKSRPFSTTFKKQIAYFNVEPLEIYYDDFRECLRNIKVPFKQECFDRAVSVVLSQLGRWEDRIWKRKS